MTSFEARTIAVKLMREHNLTSWNFEFDNAKRRLGCCKYGTKTICFSKHYQLIVGADEFVNTILHEIAHAIVGYGHGHDMVWKRKAMEIGCNGERLYQGEMKIEGKYLAVCPKCGKKHYKHRKVRSTQSCGFCSGGRFNRECLLIYTEIR